MLTVNDLKSNIDFQNDVRYYYFDYEKEERIEITAKEAEDKRITWIYCEADEIVIEVYM